MPNKLSEEQLAALQRTVSSVATISRFIIRAIRDSGVSYSEIAERADMAAFHVSQVIRSPACNGTIEDVTHILAAIGLELKVEIVPIQQGE